jgi:hypothetical protein
MCRIGDSYVRSVSYAFPPPALLGEEMLWCLIVLIRLAYSMLCRPMYLYLVKALAISLLDGSVSHS